MQIYDTPICRLDCQECERCSHAALSTQSLASTQSLQSPKGVQSLLDVLIFERGRHLHPQAGLAFGDYGETEAYDEDAEFQKAQAFGDGFGLVADHDRNDGGGRVVKVQTEFGQAGADLA